MTFGSSPGHATDAHAADARADQWIGILLRAGVVLAACVVAMGGVAYLLRHGSVIADYRALPPVPPELRRVPSILRAALAFQPTAIIQFGLVLLLATPIARVALALFLFARRRDALYVAVTTIVLALLLFSLLAGQRGA